MNNSLNYKKSKDAKISDETNEMSILCEMGNRFEYNVMKYLRNKYPRDVRKVAESLNDLTPEMSSKTLEYMKLGIPIIEQAVLYNDLNKTRGVADILIRSDWINKLIDSKPLDEEEENIKASNLNGNYHYRVIDIKWTTLNLCSDGERIRNSDRFPSYKSQLAIYNSAVGILQGYTPPKAYILAKSWKYESKGVVRSGYNCFDLLGHIDYEKFDKSYLDRTYKAINWIRNVRSNGNKWTCLPPTMPELYPNMSNRYDAPYHNIKKELADKLDELTQLWMVGPKNRFHAHKNGVFKLSDNNCNSKSLNIRGEKRSSIIDKILETNKSNSNLKIFPEYIKNNNYDWQTKSNLDFFVDFEVLNCCFIDKKIKISNSKDVTGLVFMIGIGYEENNKWMYKSFIMKNSSLNEEYTNINKFVSFVEGLVKRHMDRYKIRDRSLCNPKFFHWSKAELTFMKNACKRHNNSWSNWMKKVCWVDFCEVFQKEPVTIKGVRNFKLKDVAKKMAEYKFIEKPWDEGSSIGNGIGAMMKAATFYKHMDKQDKQKNKKKYDSLMNDMKIITRYNEGDCKAVYEIVNYLRENNCEKINYDEEIDLS